MMNVTATRRSAAPMIVQQFYHAIEFIRKQRQIANLPRIIKYMEREFAHEPKEILHYLHNAVVDGLVVETITVGCKGSKAGVEQEGYWIPDRDQILIDKESETHDWYCFHCHCAGEVASCSQCFRVYHLECLDVGECQTKDGEAWTCPCCISKWKSTSQEDQYELGRCLNFVVSQQKDHAGELRKLTDQSPYYDFFVYCHYDLNMLQKDCNKCTFSSVEEFQGKIELIRHNYSVIFGKSNKLTKLSEQLVIDCAHELEELKLCKNCFFLSNTKPMKNWFCQPCEPPHQVVWAKQKGFDFWPAKVIQVEDDRVDVRFFGKHHPRAWVTIDAVRAICVKPTELRIKRKQHWKQASAEMKEYIRQCECALGEEKASRIILYDSPYGIGKNAKLLANMVSYGKHQNGTISSLNFDLNSNKHAPKNHSNSNDENKTKTVDDDCKAEQDDNDEFNLTGSESPLKSLKMQSVERDFKPEAFQGDDNGLVETNLCDNAENGCSDGMSPDPIDLIPSKRGCDNTVIDNEEEAKLKRRKLDFSGMHSTTQTENCEFRDQQEQVCPSDLDGNECSCKLRYGTILQKFKDYVIESNRLQKGKLIRAAAFKAEYDQRQAEDQARKEVTSEYEEIIKEIKLKHQKEIEDLKLKQWCAMCKEEATHHCCKNTNYCSASCKDKHSATHRPTCKAQTAPESAEKTPRTRRSAKSRF